MNAKLGTKRIMDLIMPMMAMALFLSSSHGQYDEQGFQEMKEKIMGSMAHGPFIMGQAPHHPINRTSRDPEDLIGDWNAEYMSMNMIITSGTDQSVPNYMQRIGAEPASGSIDVSGEVSGQMNYMMAMADSGATMVMLGNNPMMGGYYGNQDDIVLPNLQLLYMHEEDMEIFMFMSTDTLAGDSIQHFWGSENASEHITLDSITGGVNIDDLSLIAMDDEGLDSTNTVLIAGSLVPESMDIVAGEPFVFSLAQEGGDGGVFVMRFLEDGTGLQMEENYDYDYWDNYDSLLIEIDTLEFDWFANDDSVTIISMDYDDYYEESYLDTMTLGYSVVGDTLHMGESFDPCMDDYYYYGDCDEYYEEVSMGLMIDDIQSILSEESYVFSRMNSLGIDQDHVLPTVMSLGQNYPNPFNPVTTLTYELSEDALVSMSVHDVSGRLVKDLVHGYQTAGHGTIKWDATNNSGQSVSAGVYLYKIQIGEMIQTKKMVLLK